MAAFPLSKLCSREVAVALTVNPIRYEYWYNGMELALPPGAEFDPGAVEDVKRLNTLNFPELLGAQAELGPRVGDVQRFEFVRSAVRTKGARRSLRQFTADMVTLSMGDCATLANETLLSELATADARHCAAEWWSFIQPSQQGAPRCALPSEQLPLLP